MRLTRRAVIASGLASLASPFPVRAESTLEWKACASLPVARSEMPATALNGRIYVAGGFGAGNRANVYDPGANAWDDLPDLPFETNHPGITAWKDSILVAGGYSSDGSSAHNGIWRYRSGDEQWVQIGTLPHPMGAFGFATIDLTVFLVGGAIDTLNGHPTDEAWAWNPESDEWTALSPLPRGREHLAMVAREQSLYVAGGRTHGQASPELGEALDIYDSTSGTWSAGAALSPPRSGLNGASVATGIVVAGGETPTEVFTSVNQFDPANGSWIDLPALPTAVHGVAVAGIDNTLFVLGGSKSAGTIDNVNEVWRLELPPFP